MSGLTIPKPSLKPGRPATPEPAEDRSPGGRESVPAPAVKLRRRPALVAVSVALVVLGALLSVWAYSSVGNAHQVVAVRSDVPRGRVITAADLVTVRIGVDPALETVPAEGMSNLVGRRAAVELKAGQLVVPSAVADAVVPGQGRSVVGLSLAAGQFPSEPLVAGDRVRVVSTPGQQGDVEADQVRVFDAVVVQVGAADVSGRSSVSVEVAAQQAPEVAARAASGKVALVLDSRER